MKNFRVESIPKFGQICIMIKQLKDPKQISEKKNNA